MSPGCCYRHRLGWLALGPHQNTAAPFAHSVASRATKPSIAARPFSSSAVGVHGPLLLDAGEMPRKMGICAHPCFEPPKCV